ncbi:hypothetical protein FR483_n181L [Paramecium bursaria Chlorella virus FR483]|uniref:Uncharacterized protein n181L n=1 Tax=Paramecium bursaria Chlorella virus FR483 TaxID=399781 RepID=A7J6N5_PBCVF|nr:hypothetical protein FR483_n181L [Paramecium bursaria Chlorella virus FR483]ABT15466.1 hypothetical protein FR483_n181L [Paramecium bursaria Chlorella virus FR483]
MHGQIHCLNRICFWIYQVMTILSLFHKEKIMEESMTGLRLALRRQCTNSRGCMTTLTIISRFWENASIRKQLYCIT